jgi:N-acetylglutamate synthase-like GNAT family acetyltransferase
LQEKSVRSFQPGDETTLVAVLNEAFQGLEAFSPQGLEALICSPSFNADGFFLAEHDDLVQGCVGVMNLPRKNAFELRYLAVREAFQNRVTADELVRRALEYVESRGPEYLKANTLSIEPYVEVFKGSGFKPVRRILRIAWDLRQKTKLPSMDVQVEELTEPMAAEAVRTYCEGLTPYWDWWTEESGGHEAVLRTGEQYVRRDLSNWVVARVEGKVAGISGVIPNSATKEARFCGVIVLPEFRHRGLGSALMRKAIDKAGQQGQERLVVFTFANLDSLAPGAVLYLKSGGKIEAEYLHLEKPV